VIWGRGAETCAELKEARFELLLIADAVVQVVATNQALVAMRWTFTTRAVADGALLLSLRLVLVLLRHHCRIKGWRYSQAA
jgi:hypothetical protein